MTEENTIDAQEIGDACSACRGTGYNAATLILHNNFHSGEQWCHALTQDEVDALWQAGRLWDFKEHPSASEVNRWSYKGFGHDVVNRNLCTQVRAMRLGVYGLCDKCGGDGETFQ